MSNDTNKQITKKEAFQKIIKEQEHITSNIKVILNMEEMMYLVNFFELRNGFECKSFGISM